MPSDSTSSSVVQLLAVAFRDAAEEHIAFTAGSVSHGCVQQFADQGIAILNDVDHRRVAAALATARRFVNRFDESTYEDFMGGLPTLIDSGQRAHKSSSAALQTLVQGNAHLQDHLQNLESKRSHLEQQYQHHKERAQCDRGSSNAWWWAAALTTPLVFGAFFWIPEQHYKGLAAGHETKADLLQQAQQALYDDLHPTFAKVASLLMLCAEAFREQTNRLEDISQFAKDAQEDQDTNCRAYFRQAKAAMHELSASIANFEDKMRVQMRENSNQFTTARLTFS